MNDPRDLAKKRAELQEEVASPTAEDHLKEIKELLQKLVDLTANKDDSAK